MIGVSLLRFSMDLSKAIDVHSVSTCLLLSKLKAYGKNGASCAFPADLRELKLVSSSLAGKASGEVSRMPASSLGPMLFSIFIDDLFFQVKVGLHLNFAEKLVFRFSLKSATLTI